MSDFPDITNPTAGTVERVRAWLGDTSDLQMIAAAMRVADQCCRDFPPGGKPSVVAREIELRCRRRLAGMIRTYQRMGLLRTRHWKRGTKPGDKPPGVSPRSVASPWELRQCYAVFDDLPDEKFEGLLDDIRNGVVVNRTAAIMTHLGKSNSGAYRRDAVARLASEGHRASQIATHLRLSEDHVRSIARRYSVSLPDAVLSHRQNPKADRVMDTTVSSLDGIAMGLRLIDPDDLDPERIDEWAASMHESLRTINQMLKEMTR